MEQHYQLSDEEFETQFANCTLDPKLFSHEAHLRLTWLYIKKYGLVKAEGMIIEQLTAYVKSLGATEKFNLTLTIAAIKAVHHFMTHIDVPNFNEFIDQGSQLKTAFKELINSHYSFDVFQSEEAKTKFIAPDLVAF